MAANAAARRLFKRASVPRGKQVKSMDVLSDVLNADVLIAVPVGLYSEDRISNCS